MGNMQNLGAVLIITSVFILSYYSSIVEETPVFNPESINKKDQFLIEDDNKSYISMNAYEEDSQTSLLNQ